MKITKGNLKKMVIQLRKKHMEIQREQFFCQDHKFKLEAEAKRNQADLVQEIIHQIENEFDLGFVWDKSLD